MNKQQTMWSAIRNGYTKKVKSEEDLRLTIQSFIKKSKENNKQEDLYIAHYNSKTIIRVYQDQNGQYLSAIIKN